MNTPIFFGDFLSYNFPLETQLYTSLFSADLRKLKSVVKSAQHTKLPPSGIDFDITNSIFLYSIGKSTRPDMVKPTEFKAEIGYDDAFFGGFLSEYMKGSSLFLCLKKANDIANISLKNPGCTFDKKK